MIELFEELSSITGDKKVEVHVFKFTHSSSWTVVIQKKEAGVELKVSGEGFDCPEAISDAIDKWKRITGGIKEFSAPMITLTPAFDDEIPF